MAGGRHTRTKSRRHRAPSRVKRFVAPGAAGALLLVTTASAVELDKQPASDVAAVLSTGDASAFATNRSETQARVSRSTNRAPVPAATLPPPDAVAAPAPIPAATPTAAAVPTPVGSRFATAQLNVRGGPSKEHDVLATVELGTELPITGVVADGWAEVIHEGAAAWVNATYLAETKPEPEAVAATGGVSAAACVHGSEVERGLKPDTVLVHRAVCAQFPQITSYGGLRGDGEHGQGLALDIMVGRELGDEVAAWLQANHAALGVEYLIWEQRIWQVARASDGWSMMSDRGSATANHYDHVHVTVYGNAAG